MVGAQLTDEAPLIQSPGTTTLGARAKIGSRSGISGISSQSTSSPVTSALPAVGGIRDHLLPLHPVDQHAGVHRR